MVVAAAQTVSATDEHTADTLWAGAEQVLQGAHVADPVVDAKVLAAQGIHAVAPTEEEYKPGEHNLQEDWPVTSW